MENTSLEAAQEGAQKEQFNFAHLGLIALCAVFLLSVSIVKKGFVFGFSQTPKKTAHKLTYQEALAQVEAENNFSSSSSQIAGSQNSDSAEQLALVDPGFQSGQVAGVSTGTVESELNFQGAQDVLSSGKLNEIQIKLSASEGLAAVKKYADDVFLVESSFDSLGSLQSLAGEDKTSLQKSKENLYQMVGYLYQVEVPPELAEYHRLKIYFYGTQIAIANFYLGDPEAENLDDLSAMFFAATDKIQSIKNSLFEKYQIEI